MSKSVGIEGLGLQLEQDHGGRNQDRPLPIQAAAARRQFQALVRPLAYAVPEDREGPVALTVTTAKTSPIRSSAATSPGRWPISP